MLHNKFRGNQSQVPEKKIFEVFFLPYIGMAAILVT